MHNLLEGFHCSVHIGRAKSHFNKMLSSMNWDAADRKYVSESFLRMSGRKPRLHEYQL